MSRPGLPAWAFQLMEILGDQDDAIPRVWEMCPYSSTPFHELFLTSVEVGGTAWDAVVH